MKVWISGAHGYVGAALVPFLLHAGYKVVGYDVGWFGDKSLPKGHPRLKVINGDIRNANAVAASMLGCDAAVHLAGITCDRNCQLEPELADDVNVEAFRGLLDAVKSAGVGRLLFLSSAAAYGSTDAPVTEETKLGPTTRYGLSKLYCEQLLRRTTDTPWVILRPAGVCGFSPRMRIDLTVNRMVRDAFFTGAITVFGGQQVRPNLHIRDLLAAIKTLLTEEVAGQTFNLGCQNVTVREVANMVSYVTGARMNITQREDDRSYSIDSSRIARVLDFVPRFSIESAIYDLYSRFKAGYWKDAMQNTNYMNVRREALEKAAIVQPNTHVKERG